LFVCASLKDNIITSNYVVRSAEWYEVDWMMSWKEYGKNLSSSEVLHLCLYGRREEGKKGGREGGRTSANISDRIELGTFRK
jgi:hypothetical protein